MEQTKCKQNCSVNSKDNTIAIDSCDVITINDEDDLEMEEGEVPDRYVPMVEIKFKSSEIFRAIGSKLIDALEVTLNANVAPAENENYEFRLINELDDSITIRVQIKEAVQKIHSNPVPSHKEKKEKTPDLVGLAELFMIDTSPAETLDAVQVPSYKRTIKDVLDNESSASKKQKDEFKCEKPRPSNSCFNCSSMDHALRDCPRPRNNKRILRAKQALATRNDRYHSDTDKRYSSMRPGDISKSLREALGLQNDELPKFIYKMRVFGYPPGWLEDARVAHSGMTLYNADTEELLAPDSTSNELDRMQNKFDVSKLVDFPGFNTHPGVNYIDNYRYHNVPPIQPLQMKREFIKLLGDNVVNGFKHKKIKSLSRANKLRLSIVDNLQAADMEIEDMECETQASKSPSPKNDSSTQEVGLDAQPLSALEEKQQRLLRALQVDAGFNDSSQDSSMSIKSENDQTGGDADSSATITEASILPHDKNSPKFDGQVSSPKTPPRHSTPIYHNYRSPDVIKESHIGTPILKFSPFDKLPAGENFKVGVSDVINFENLPDSTGKYENMKCVIRKVRKIITKLHSEDD